MEAEAMAVEANVEAEAMAAAGTVVAVMVARARAVAVRAVAVVVVAPRPPRRGCCLSRRSWCGLWPASPTWARCCRQATRWTTLTMLHSLC